MTITVCEDESEAGGFALIDLGRRVTPPLLSLRRLDTEPRHLGLGGWQPEIAWLAPLSVKERDGSTVVRFGPQIVDCIEELVPIEIVAQDGGAIGTVVWPFITPAAAGRSMLVVEPVAVAAPLIQTSSPPAEPAAPEIPLPDVSQPAVVTRSVESAASLPEHQAATPVAPFPKHQRGWGWLVAAAILACAGGTAVWQRASVEAWFRPTSPLADDASSTASAVAPAASAAPLVPAPAAQAPSRAELRQKHALLLRDRAPAEAFVELGTSALAAGQGEVAFRAFEEADPAVNLNAAWQLARLHDPRNTEASYRETVGPNVPRAAYYYALWRNRSPRHTEELRALCAVSTELVSRDERLRTLCQP